jgi:hypothetical protein
MRTWVKVSIVGASLAVLAFVALAGTGAFFVLRRLNVSTATEGDVTKDFDAIRSRFGARPPLIEVTDVRGRDFKINRPQQADGRPISTLHVLTWTQEDGQVFRTEVPIWLMRFSSINILSQLGVAPERFRLTVQDIERYGPGVIVDFRRPEENRVLLWVE